MESQFAGSDCVLQVPNVSLFVQGQDRGPGILSIEEGYVQWSNDDQSDIMTLQYPSISLHAVSRDLSTFPHPCLYILYCPLDTDDENDDDDDPDEEGSPIEKITEIRFVPLSSDQLDGMYSAICECQTLYPDPELSSDSEAEGDNNFEEVELDENEGGVFYTSAEEGLPHLSVEGRAVLEHLESVIQMPRPEEFTSMINNEEIPTNGDDNNGQFEDVPDDS